jgi:hypothetical protein
LQTRLAAGTLHAKGVLPQCAAALAKAGLSAHAKHLQARLAAGTVNAEGNLFGYERLVVRDGRSKRL